MQRWTVLALAALFGMGLPAKVNAQDFGSSMSAFCYTIDCSVVQYDLVLDPAAYVTYLTWTVEGSAKLAGITFDGFIEAEDPSWTLKRLSDNSIQLEADGDALFTPTWFRLSMSNVTSATELTGGEAVRYDGMAYSSYEDGVLSGGGDFGGHVTPEPVTVLLLGAGLAGLGAAGFVRRRREEQEELSG